MFSGQFGMWHEKNTGLLFVARMHLKAFIEARQTDDPVKLKRDCLA
jgi:hypothetical protein